MTPATGERSRLLTADSNSLNTDGSQESLQAHSSNYYSSRPQVTSATWNSSFTVELDIFWELCFFATPLNGVHLDVALHNDINVDKHR
jgi:hypothetical protein